jgi:predicted lipoprotein with Yx(FWY)xxD motif
VKRSFFSAVAAVAIMALAACGGGGSSGGTVGNPNPNPNPPTAAPTAAPTNPPGAPASMPQLAQVAGAQAYVGSSNQHTLYTFGADTANKSNCTSAVTSQGKCTDIWPPYTAPAGTQAPSGSGFGIIQRSDGSMQWTYQSFPLYTYSGDPGALQANGQGINAFGGVWGVARPAAAASPGPTSSPSHCVGYYC